MATKPSIPKGTRDFSPIEMARRNYIFDTIKQVFRLHGFSQIETPSMENLSTLMGKYGEEGDKLLFKILNSGDYLKGVDRSLIESGAVLKLAPQLCEKGLRYDLTVPFARFVVQHRNDVQFPFRRFQIHPVWRADRRQKGRYREFYQCDADIVGSDSLWNEVELLEIISEVFKKLRINVVIKVNNRKILAGIAEVIGEPERLIDITVAIDKIDKIGIENVNAELIEKGLSQAAVDKLQPILSLSGTTQQRLDALRDILATSEIGLKGVDELSTVLAHTAEADADADIKATVELDVSLARGLNYYTGTIIEVKAADFQIGSITGGGRYDNLTGVFGMPGVSGVGISFGADRIYDVLEGLKLYPAGVLESTKVMFANFGDKEMEFSQKAAAKLRRAGVATMVYPDAAKMKKQFSYADSMKIPYVAIVGDAEMAEGKVNLKEMSTGRQELLTVAEVIEKLCGDFASLAR